MIVKYVSLWLFWYAAKSDVGFYYPYEHSHGSYDFIYIAVHKNNSFVFM